MREFLFRAKRIDNNQWVEGYYVMCPTRMICPNYEELKNEEIEHFIVFCSFSDSGTRRILNCVKVNPETVGQFIGMFDVNGRRIFEGDILNVMGYEGVLTAEWWTPHRGFGFGKGTLYCDETESNMIEVIGNIYDNPELMEGMIERLQNNKTIQ